MRVVDDEITLSVDNLVIGDGRVGLESAVAEGSPHVGGVGDGGSFTVRAEVRELAWPRGPAADFTITARTDPGTIDVDGTFAPDTNAVSATVRAADAALAPFGSLLPLAAPVGGRLDAQLRAVFRPETAPALTVEGALALHDVRLGREDAAPLRANALTVDRLELADRTLDVGRIFLTRPSALVERREDGSFPLRAMLTPPDSSDNPYTSPGEPADAPAAPADAAARSGEVAPRPGDAAARPGDASAPEPWRIEVDRVQVLEGNVRFLDRTTRPFLDATRRWTSAARWRHSAGPSSSRCRES